MSASLLFAGSFSVSYLADVDECGEQSSCCQQDCTNYPGGYECYCAAGYRLGSDGCGCDGMSPVTHAAALRVAVLSCGVCV